MTLTNLLVTAYCSCSLCCGPHAHNIAANGRKPVQGITVAASRSIPLGTSIHIDGMTNHFIVSDRYNKKLGDRIDIYFSSHQAAKNFGAKHLTVTINTPKTK